MLAPGKIQHILCTGNLCCRDAENYLRQICSDVNCVKGDFDDPSAKDTQEYLVVKLENFRIGLIHGHQVVPWGDRESLAMWQRRLDVDVLVFGGTHQYVAFEHEGKLFVNPGSITGAFSFLNSPTGLPGPGTAPMSERSTEVYGFVFSVMTAGAFVVFLGWAYLPEHWYRSLGITYYPDKYWSVALPAWSFATVVYAILFYHAKYLLNTPPLDDIHTITDSFAKGEQPVLGALAKDSSIPPVADIPISVVNRLLHHRPAPAAHSLPPTVAGAGPATRARLMR
jgi:vacuolar protein sorting-associated protein 29